MLALDDLADHAKQVLPHPEDDAICVCIRQRFSKRQRQIVATGFVTSHLPRQHAMDEPRKAIGHLDGCTQWQRTHDEQNRLKRTVFRQMPELQHGHGIDFETIHP